MNKYPLEYNYYTDRKYKTPESQVFDSVNAQLESLNNELGTSEYIISEGYYYKDNRLIILAYLTSYGNIYKCRRSILNNYDHRATRVTIVNHKLEDKTIKYLKKWKFKDEYEIVSTLRLVDNVIDSLVESLSKELDN